MSANVLSTKVLIGDTIFYVWVLVGPRESNPRPPALQSSAHPTELTLPRLFIYLFIYYLFIIDKLRQEAWITHRASSNTRSRSRLTGFKNFKLIFSYPMCRKKWLGCCYTDIREPRILVGYMENQCFFFVGFMLARMFRKLRWTTQVRKTNLNNFKKCMLVYKNLHGLAPAYLLNEF